jgi:hypothetical protein
MGVFRISAGAVMPRRMIYLLERAAQDSKKTAFRQIT